MRRIAHRGNIHKKDASVENLPSQVELCEAMGYDIEIDIRLVEGRIYLGHDYPDHLVGASWLNKLKGSLWIHCKNFEAMRYFSGSDFNYFWHDTDDHTLTSKGYVWTYPGRELFENSIAVLPESWTNKKDFNCFGVCSDLICEYSK